LLLVLRGRSVRVKEIWDVERDFKFHNGRVSKLSAREENTEFRVHGVEVAHNRPMRGVGFLTG